MKIRNVSPFGDLAVPLLGRTVKADEVVTVNKTIGAQFLEQPSNFEQVDGPAAPDAPAPDAPDAQGAPEGSAISPDAPTTEEI